MDKTFMQKYRAEKRSKVIKKNTRLLIKSIKIISIILAIYLMLDMISFFAWVLSEQTPHDTIYIGSVTKNIISLIIK